MAKLGTKPPSAPAPRVKGKGKGKGGKGPKGGGKGREEPIKPGSNMPPGPKGKGKTGVQCFVCGENHYARDCPSKGDGKGDWKGKGKGDWKGKGKGDWKGKGKGFGTKGDDKDGVKVGSPVIGPGGLLGRVENISFFTSSIILLTSPESKVGVWVDRVQSNGLLVGAGDKFPKLIFYTKDIDIKVGDVVSSSPASTLFPPNIPIGIVQSVQEPFRAKKTAKISLLAHPQLIDWVQIYK